MQSGDMFHVEHCTYIWLGTFAFRKWERLIRGELGGGEGRRGCRALTAFCSVRRASGLIVSREYFVDVIGMARNCGIPFSEPAVGIYGPNPFTQELALGLLLLIVLPFNFQHEHLAATEPNQIVRAELVNDAPERIHNLEAQVIVLRPGPHIWVAV